MTTYWLTGRSDEVLDRWHHRRLVCCHYQQSGCQCPSYDLAGSYGRRTGTALQHLKWHLTLNFLLYLCKWDLASRYFVRSSVCPSIKQTQACLATKQKISAKCLVFWSTEIGRRHPIQPNILAQCDSSPPQALISIYFHSCRLSH